MYDNKIFRSVANTDNGEVSGETLFYYHQQDRIVWADYSGGAIIKGFLIATVQDDQSLEMRYEHINAQHELMTGRCKSIPEQLPDGRIRLHERWQWTSGDQSSGESVIEEVPS
ncbi:n-acetylglutamate synthase [Spirosoma sp. SC4-14]|uniref:n-acetylglutamate synthase n=1 Tax=Spirosoma sp. SC4-14 TaxID=3128900 RepID=UPI0030CAB0BA